MTDDLLRALGQHQQAALDRDQPADDDELGRPFQGAEREALLDDLFARLDAGQPEPETAVASTPAEPEQTADNVVPLAPRRRGAWAGTLIAAAAAATLVWWVVPGSDGTELDVPPYSFSRLEGGDVATRSDHTAPERELKLRPDSTINWELTPDEPTRSPVGVALRAKAEDGQQLFLPQVDAEISASGAVRLRGRLDRWLTLSPGVWTLTLFVAPAEQLPRDAEQANEPGAWRTLDVRVTIVVGE